MVTTMGTQVETLKNYVGGRWLKATATETQEVRNPATDDVLAHVPLSNLADVDTAVRAAAAAFPAWRSTPPQERARYLFTLRQLLVEHREELARLIVTEMG
jgi:malonate-semialdehyde dehydrogenase (acetylating)/methylmalonate-semialdehyde dehydrogenase